MAIKVALLYSLFLIYAGVECQILVKPDLEEVCVGSNVTLNWTYGDANNFALVTWTYIDSSSAETVIMQHANGVPVSVTPGHSVQHDGNGAMTLTNVALSNTGAYKIDVSYTSATTADDDTVSVTVRDPPTGLSASKTASNGEITYTCILTTPGDPAADLYIHVNDEDRTSTVSAVVKKDDIVKCCINGSSVACMSGVTSTVFCQCIQCDLCKCPLWDCKCKKKSAECIVCWIVFILLILIGPPFTLFLIGVIIGICIIATRCCCRGFYHFKDSDCECYQGCGKNKYVTCACCASLPCKGCCNIAGLPFWVQVLWGTIIGAPVALGIYMVWKCCGRGNGNVDAKCEDPKPGTQSGNPRTGQKKSELKNKTKISAQTENEQHNQERKPREQPPIPLKAQTTETTMSGRPIPAIPSAGDRQGHDSKGRGLSANFNDDDHPLIGVDIPSKKAGALGALPEGTGGEEPVKKKKKRKKKTEEDRE